MPNYFPLPYPDELIYSTIARYIRHHNLVDVYRTKPTSFRLDLFGNDCKPAVDIPVGISYLVNNTTLKNYDSEEEIVFKHTLFPYYTAFAGVKHRDDLLDGLLGNRNWVTRWNRISIFTPVCTSNSLKFCPSCIKDDTTLRGEPYWHRIHQVPGVHICPTHETYLQIQCQSCGESFPKDSEEYLALYDVCSNGHSLLNTASQEKESASLDKDLRYAKDALNILDNPTCYELEYVQALFRAKLQYSGLASINGKVHVAKVCQALVEFYGIDFMRRMRSLPDDNSATNWVNILFGKQTNPRHTHPLRQILLIGFLFPSFDAFLASKPEFLPFAHSPWPCLNSLAGHFNQDIITDCKMSRSKSLPPIIGTFTCECGFKYSRRGPDTSEADRLRYDIVVDHGNILREKIRELYFEKHLTIHQITKRLGHSYPLIRKALSSLIIKTKSDDDMRRAYREKVIALIEQSPTITRNEIHNKDRRILLWLYMHDREWLDQNLPTVVTLKPPPKINWAKRDDQYFGEVAKSADKLIKSSSKPLRVSQESLLGPIRLRTLIPANKDKLPKTIALMNSKIEARSDYLDRLLDWAIKHLSAKNEQINVDSIRKITGLGRARNPYIIEYLKRSKDSNS